MADTKETTAGQAVGAFQEFANPVASSRETELAGGIHRHKAPEEGGSRLKNMISHSRITRRLEDLPEFDHMTAHKRKRILDALRHVRAFGPSSIYQAGIYQAGSELK